ncbi:hypothetical protein [Synechococcus virus S-ESS1]|uniref:Uncharacterized protein n=1 Tax=Synechococcus virus S-ESS1 TaxID=1964565 RepID=A0A1V0DX70_9CAUD|nr:hypothetical protein JT310_gp28 [Synechococcus virus S-ESS1]ARB05730.1 hypothetical protein [Synechococcus virus S-ESS1]
MGLGPSHTKARLPHILHRQHIGHFLPPPTFRVTTSLSQYPMLLGLAIVIEPKIAGIGRPASAVGLSRSSTDGGFGGLGFGISR